ncbi:Hypothetical predicted protein [Cloeon dipterum]|uniref:C2H2-type domain-containing protein n=1 Tax=Cloeon dipterum TaxID=197152 RepID=A0A8S1DDY2_9INSE|nr:Hypothetical predicted protein [Cloeon dipterum]
MKLRTKEGKTPIQKPLCRLCECPTSDGHVLASQVDRSKLRKWAMKVMNLTERDENLPEVVEKVALICYFCIWQAEFGDESGDEAVAWWPKNLDLAENAKVLRENYSAGNVEQCWVQLEEVDLAKHTKAIPKKRNRCGGGVCVFCGKRYNYLLQHVNLKHKEAIKCGIRGCTTFFNTEEEKEQHMQVSHAKHDKSRERLEKCCEFCGNFKAFSSVSAWRKHMKRVHPEFSIRCSLSRCKKCFKSKSEMLLHVDSSHKLGKSQDLFHCKHCEYITTLKDSLRKHEEARHMPKRFKCDTCDAKFGSKSVLKTHYFKIHTFSKCKSCGQDVALAYKALHRRPSVCSKCKLKFECLGLYRLHRKSCKQTLCTCKECGKSFIYNSELNLHVRTVHTKTEKFHCEHCDYSTFSRGLVMEHIQRMHFPKTFECGACHKSFASERILKNHKYTWHEYVRCAECAQRILRQPMFKHRTVKTCLRCKCKFKCSGLLAMHVKSCVQENNNYYYCDKCPKFYRRKGKMYDHFVKKHIEN